ncbi:flagellar biosynthesis protein FliO [Acidimicrobium ferrooxidans DSM 10331]|uniref:Flagellar biosynthesis protein FliO n=1 Tax=Acidimicrobium ferrooxidans (strain DSM 10331 / JCM 15462 / NBRC 103882 / ICP) TaxID=525909 RepID=C7M223_ACIFD|nr:flagellar biosynthetic protein FliO [Acidimicrobium ferrooxidans]ACU53121.1 flagellar biosynthesis protein FliO [Acidimicrobium ferrooxidans DSM 10331]
MGSIVEAIGALALVVGLIVASGRLAQRGRPARSVGMARLAVVARASLGSKTSIVIVEADGRRFLLGVGPQGASRLASLGAAPPADAPEIELLDLRDVDVAFPPPG